MGGKRIGVHHYHNTHSPAHCCPCVVFLHSPACAHPHNNNNSPGIALPLPTFTLALTFTLSSSTHWCAHNSNMTTTTMWKSQSCNHHDDDVTLPLSALTLPLAFTLPLSVYCHTHSSDIAATTTWWLQLHMLLSPHPHPPLPSSHPGPYTSEFATATWQWWWRDNCNHTITMALSSLPPLPLPCPFPHTVVLATVTNYDTQDNSFFLLASNNGVVHHSHTLVVSLCLCLGSCSFHHLITFSPFISTGFLFRGWEGVIPICIQSHVPLYIYCQSS